MSSERLTVKRLKELADNADDADEYTRGSAGQNSHTDSQIPRPEGRGLREQVPVL